MANVLYDALCSPHVASSRIFLTMPNGQERCFKRFFELASQFAHVLLCQGVRPGDRVAMQVSKSPEALALYVACVQAGAVFLPLNTAYKHLELDYFIGDAEPRLLICDPISEAELSPIARRYNAQLLTLSTKASGSLMDAASEQATAFDAVDREGDDLAAFLYTSGTTGRSKGAMLSQNNLLSNAKSLVEYWRFNQDDVLLHALPIFHTHGLFVACNTLLLAGGSMLFHPSFDINDVIASLPKASTMMGVPTFYTRLLNDPRFNQGLVEHMRLFISGSAPLLAETHLEFEARCGHSILERYGMTETNMSTSNPYAGVRKPGTVGLALPQVETKICNAETGKELAQGEIGVLEVRGPNVFKGYWKLPEKTAEELREDGFFITGDLACIDKDGYLQIVGRSKDLIITGGYNVYPKELELLLDEQEGVLESAVFGVPHSDFGEAVVGVLVEKPGAELNTALILSGIENSIAKFKQPKKLYIIDELPRNAMGKVQKNSLREHYKALFI
jgi:malonyl-CoA/methylmalonyl-CoA synthetase